MSRRALPTVAVLALLVLAPVTGLASPADAASPLGTGAGATAATATTPTAAGPSGSGALADAGTDGTVRLAYRFERVPSTPGVVSVRATARLPSGVERFELDPPDRAVRVTATDGFRRGGNGTYEWDGRTRPASVTYRARVNETSDFGGLDAVDVGEWALFDAETADASVRWWAASSYDWSESFVAASPGTVGGDLVVLGPANETAWTAAGQQFRIVRPAAATLAPAPAAVRATLTAAAGDLAVGARDDRVTAIVAPPPVRGGGQAHGARDGRQGVWVHQGSPVGPGWNVWVHEYVHTRQAFETTERTAWLTEGSAEYYEHLLTYYQGRRGFVRAPDPLHTELAEVPDDAANATLADSSTWANTSAEYEKGALVVAALDAAIRRETANERTFEDVFRRLNDRASANGSALTHAALADAVENVAGRSFDAWLDRYVRSRAAPPLPRDPALFVPPARSTDADGDGLVEFRETVTLGTDPALADTDRDGLNDGAEVAGPTDPLDADTDGDGLDDGTERARGTDPTAADTDRDGLRDPVELERGTDPLDADTDGDGLDDGAEREVGTDPLDADTDGDGLEDRAELERGIDPTVADTDGDGLADGTEAAGPTDPLAADSDGDGLDDGAERAVGADPLVVDTDGDGLDDGAEHALGTDPTAADTDGDGLADHAELERDTDPTAADTDGDGLADRREVTGGTDPTAADTDGDGLADRREVTGGTDPTTPTPLVAYVAALLLSHLLG